MPAHFSSPPSGASGSHLGAWSALTTGATVKAGQTVTYGGVLYARIADGTIASTFGQGHWTAIGPSAVSSYPALDGLQPVNGQSAPPSGLSDGTKLWSEYRYRMTVGDDLNVVSFTFGNWYVNVSGATVFDVDGPNDIRVACTIERLDGTFLPVPFGGDLLATIKPGAQRRTNPTDPDVPASDGYYWLRVYVEVTNLGEKWPLTGRALNFATSEGFSAGTTAGTGATSTGTITASGGNAYSPIAAAGRTKLQRTKSVAVLHDSIGTGQGDFVASEGWIYRSLGVRAPCRSSGSAGTPPAFRTSSSSRAASAVGRSSRARPMRSWLSRSTTGGVAGRSRRCRPTRSVSWRSCAPGACSTSHGRQLRRCRPPGASGSAPWPTRRRMRLTSSARTSTTGCAACPPGSSTLAWTPPTPPRPRATAAIWKIQTGTGTLTSGSIAMTGVTAGSVYNGQVLTGAGIPRAPRSRRVAGTTVNLSAAATASGATTFTYAGTTDGVHPRKWVHDLMKAALDGVLSIWQA